MIDWSTPLDTLRQSKRDAAADNATARKERQKLHAAIAAIRYRREHGLPLAERCTTKGCGLWPWEHGAEIFPCSPAGLWVPVLRVMGHRALCAAVKDLEGM